MVLAAFAPLRVTLSDRLFTHELGGKLFDDRFRVLRFLESSGEDFCALGSTIPHPSSKSKKIRETVRILSSVFHSIAPKAFS